MAWYDQHGRDFAWRHTTDPYEVLLAEMMVQRTRAAQAERVWSGFIRMYPTLEAARAASDEELLMVLQPLGLKWRAKNIVSAIREMDGDKRGTRAMAGVDHYVESAVRCFALGQREPVVDSNVVRVYSRFFGFDADDRTRRTSGFHALARLMLSATKAREYNWALLDLGGAVCLSRPVCEACPLALHCVFHRTEMD